MTRSPTSKLQAPPLAPKHDPYGALREPNYRLFVAGWVFASTGLQMQGTALGWEIYEITKSPMHLGFAGLARALPVLLLALPAGQIVDLLDRKKILVFTQIAFAIASALLALGSWAHASIWVLYILIALTGCARVFNGPSRSSLLPHIVSPSRFQNAVTWNSGVFQLSATLGPLLAGLLITWLAGAWVVYAIAGASCLWFGLLCSFIKPRAEGSVSSGQCTNCNYDLADLIADQCPECGTGVIRHELGPAAAKPADTSVLSNAAGISHTAPIKTPPRVWDAIRPSVLLPGMLEGARHVWREKTVLGALALDLFAVLLGGATALLPIYAKDILHVGPLGLGMLRASPYVGALIMAFILAHRPPMKRAGRALLWSVAGFGLCTIVFGLSTNVVLSVIMLLSLGALDNISVVIRHVLVAVRTPNALRGRVNAVNSVFIESSNELGAFESGGVASLAGHWLGHVGGTVFSAVFGGVGTVLVVLALAWKLPELRQLGRLEEPK